MPLSLKELETMLWQSPGACEAQGLTVQSGFFCAGSRYRNLALAAYGTAQLVNVRYCPPERRFYVQVFVLTAGAINLAAYQRVKRCQTALREAVRQALATAGLVADVVTRGVLIGQRVQLTGDFVYCLNHDPGCQAFTYCYGVNGVGFEDVGKGWHLRGSEQSEVLAQVGAELLRHREQALAEADEAEVPEESARAEASPSSLVVTAEGILMNSDLAGGEAAND